MPITSIRALCGRTLAAAGVLCIAGGLLHPVEHGEAHSAAALESSHEWLASGLLLGGTVLLVLALPGVYGWLAPRLGRLGLVAVVLYLVGNLLSAVPHLVVNAFVGPELAHRAPDLVSPHDFIIDSDAFAVEQVASGLVLLLGLLLLGVALLRSGAVPRWVGALGVLGAVVTLVPLPVAAVVSGLQIELLRGAMVIALGVLAARTARVDAAAAPAPTPRVPVGAAS